ncbi:MAG: TonB-dependent receptor plug domain-containing protein, partial [Alphaproteobacteria bacterium]|nr:TonB-dependent receptor plug domain-containing protein [Alphaproteobacteria bacterium]
MAIEEVVVTGSRIRHKDLESVSPLMITPAAQIKLSGYNRIEDMMNSLPQIEASQTAFISNGATGAASLDLRGLGAIRTLVLINGRRMQPGGLSQSSPDINQIPAGLVKRVETLTGGASAIYGADAVAGVVNFIMDDNFNGIQVTTGFSGYQHNNRNSFVQGLLKKRNFKFPTGSTGIDGTQYNVELIMGSGFADDKGHATVYASYRKVNELRQGARDYSSCALSSKATSCGGSANAIVPNFYISSVTPSGGYDWSNPKSAFLSMNSSSALVPWDGTNRYNYAPINHFQRPDERWSGGAFINYTINDHFKPYMEFSFMSDRTRAQIAESGTFFVTPYKISCSNPMLNANFLASTCGNLGLGPNDSFSTYIGKRNVEGGPRTSILAHNSFRMVTGMKGDIAGGWTYDASFLYGQTSSQEVYVNDFYAPSIVKALDVIRD